MKTLMALAALIFTSLCSASNIDLNNECSSSNMFISSQEEVDAVVDCLYNNRHEMFSNRAGAVGRLSSVSPLFEIDVEKLTKSIPLDRDDNFYRYYIETVASQSGSKVSRILAEHYEKFAISMTSHALHALLDSTNPDDWKTIRELALRLHKAGKITIGELQYITSHTDQQLKDPRKAITENLSKKQNAKLTVERNIINMKYSYLRRLSKKDPSRYLDDAEKRLDELEKSLVKHIGDRIKVYHKGNFQDDYSRLGDYAAHIAGEPEKAIDFYLKEVEYKVVPRALPDNLSESQKRKYREDGRAAMQALLAMGAIGNKPNTPCYKIYELLGNHIGKNHRAYAVCLDELKRIGIPLVSIIGNKDKKLEPSVLNVKVKLTDSTEGEPSRHARKVLIESAYTDLKEHFCNELQLVELDSEGEATITVRKNRVIRATLIDRELRSDASEEGKKLSTIFTHENSTRFNEIVLHAEPVSGDPSDFLKFLMGISITLNDCRDHMTLNPILANIDKTFYLMSDSGPTNATTTKSTPGYFLKNAVFSSYYNDVAHADELGIYKHGVLHRLFTAPDTYEKADLYAMEKGLLLDQVQPVQNFIHKYGRDALNSYFGDECSFTSYILNAERPKRDKIQELANILLVYQRGSYISKDKFTSNRKLYMDTIKKLETQEDPIRSELIDYAIENELGYSNDQSQSHCNKLFIDEYLTKTFQEYSIQNINVTVKLGVSPNYTTIDGDPYIAKVFRNEDMMLTLLKLGTDHAVKFRNGVSLLSAAIDMGYKKTLIYYIKNNFLYALGSNDYVKLFAINFGEPGINSKLFTYLVSLSDSESDKVIQAATIANRPDILGAMFSVNIKIKKSYESPIYLNNRTNLYTLDGMHDEFLILNAARAHYTKDTSNTIDLLFKNGANIHAIDRGETALLYAAKNGTYELVSKLIDIGADPSFVPHDGNPAILRASMRNLGLTNGCLTHLPEIGDAVKLYLDSNKNAPDRDENEHCRIKQFKNNLSERTGSDYKIVKLLIDNHVDINVSTRFGMTPLMLYALKHDDRVVDLLLKAGAEPEAKDAYGKTYRDYRKDTAPKITIQSPTGKAYMGGSIVVPIPAQH